VKKAAPQRQVLRRVRHCLYLAAIGAVGGVLLLDTHSNAATSTPSDNGIFGASAPATEAAATPLPGFQDNTVFSGLTNPTQVRFASDGRVFVAEKSGLVKVFDNLSDPTPTVFADLRTNVDNYWDRGLLGMALDPGFTTGRPYVYLLYTYDAPIGGTAPVWNDACPTPPGPTTNGCVVSGRLSRLTANGNVQSGPEQVLINDWCQQFPSHSIGSLVFGSDGALYASGGDGASFNFADYGQAGNPCGDPPSPAGTNLTPPSAEGGALRSQDLRTSADPASLNGAILRLNPDTGAAATGNPNGGSSDANARRIIAEGFRNPFRVTIRPGTNEVWIGDVGWNDWEEIDRITTPTSSVGNFGWPCYEGPLVQLAYQNTGLNICTNLYNAGSGAVVTPHYAYTHNGQVVSGETCPVGSSSIAGMAFYQGGSYPSSYNGALFFADYSRKCIWVMFPGGNGLPNPSTISTFDASAAGPVDLQIGPGGDLFYADYDTGTIRRIQYGGSTPPGTSYLSDLTWTSMTNGYGPAEKDMSNGGFAGGDGLTITLNGTTYAKGLGVHAASDIQYSLAGTCSRFKASVGVDDEVGANGSVVFQVFADASKVYDSGTMTGATATKTIDVSVASAQALRLVVTDAGNGITSDHADWAAARVECGSADTTPPTVTGQAPAPGASGVALSVTPSATFSESINPSTLTTSTFTLVKQGTSTPLAASVSYSDATHTATLTPNAALEASTGYTATVKGGGSGVKDVAGNALAADSSWGFTTGASGGTSSSYLSDLTWTSATSGYGPVEKDTSNGGFAGGDGLTITLNGTTYAKGLGVHADSDVQYSLGGTCSRFKASVGVDDEVGANGSVVFQVFAGASKVYDSGTMTGATATKTIDVSVASAQTLRLVVTGAGDGLNSDHADWASARVEC
jgi:glucose/arabinose dehydrogenase